jgi:hypothetical protein
MSRSDGREENVRTDDTEEFRITNCTMARGVKTAREWKILGLDESEDKQCRSGMRIQGAERSGTKYPCNRMS